MQLMNLVMSVLPNKGSGKVSRFGTSRRLGMLNDLHSFLIPVSALGGEYPPRANLVGTGNCHPKILAGRLTRHPTTVFMKE